MGARTVSTRQARDPVCGCEIAAGEAHFAAQLDGRPYAFCTEACRDRFLRDPGRYVGISAEKKKRKGRLARFLDRLARSNEETFGKGKPKCCP